MNILFVVPYTPTPIRTRSYNLLRTLARRGHAITLATLWENEQERSGLKQLENQGICVIAAQLTRPRSAWNCLRALPTVLPLQSVYCWQPELLRLLGSRLQVQGSKFNIVHVEHLRGARYGLESPISSLQSPVLWDSVDCISYLFEQAAQSSRSGFGRLVTRFELPRTKKYEARLVNHFDRVLVTSPMDAVALEALVSGSTFHVSGRAQPVASGNEPGTRNPGIVSRRPQSATGNHAISHLQSPISILPNGVDLDYFSPPDAAREPATVVFSGKMSYHANITAALHLVDDIMPHVWKERPSVRLQIVGQDPPSKVRKLVTGHGSRVTVTGRVPDMRPYLQRATLAIAPMAYGAGIQNKVLEAMACATPVVATSQAVSALRVCPAEHVLVADEPAELARQILRLLDHRELQSCMGRAGRRYVEQHHDWDMIAERLELIYHEEVGKSVLFSQG